MSETKKTLSQVRKAEVKVVRAHGNDFGKKFHKKKDETYIHPRPEADVKAGLVKLVEDGNPPEAAKGK